MAKSKLTTCKTCGAEIAKDAKVCPKCGAKNKKKFGALRIILGVFIVLMGIGMLGGALGGGSESSDGGSSTKNPLNESTQSLEVENGVDGISVEKDQFTWYFNGYVVNNKDKDLAYCQIEINLYDKEGALLGTAVDNVNNLKAGGKWKFKAMTLLTSDQLAEVDSWELGEVTGW